MLTLKRKVNLKDDKKVLLKSFFVEFKKFCPSNFRQRTDILKIQANNVSIKTFIIIIRKLEKNFLISRYQLDQAHVSISRLLPCTHINFLDAHTFFLLMSMKFFHEVCKAEDLSISFRRIHRDEILQIVSSGAVSNAGIGRGGLQPASIL